MLAAEAGFTNWRVASCWEIKSLCGTVSEGKAQCGEEGMYISALGVEAVCDVKLSTVH